MKNKKFKITAFLFLGLGLLSLQAQESIPASGGVATGSGGTTSYSVGQVVYTTNAGTTGTVSQGVQQPFEISVVTQIKNAENIKLEAMVYPNPTKEFVKLKVESYKVENLIYEIYNINGKLLQSKKIENEETNIEMKSFAGSTYFIKVMQKEKEIKTFKIIKN
jgi:hypothetical protein